MLYFGFGTLAETGIVFLFFLYYRIIFHPCIAFNYEGMGNELVGIAISLPFKREAFLKGVFITINGWGKL